MDHYYTDNENTKDEPCQVDFEIDGHTFLLQSNAGVFSSHKLDSGTRILLDTVLEHQPKPESVLDLGAGIGIVGVVCSYFWKCKVIGVEVSSRAADLARTNYERNKVDGEVLHQDGTNLDNLGTYECVLINPPIRAGKSVVYAMLEQGAKHLTESGSMWVVMRKQHGAQSAMKHLQQLGYEVERVARDLGFWILRVQKGKDA